MYSHVSNKNVIRIVQQFDTIDENNNVNRYRFLNWWILISFLFKTAIPRYLNQVLDMDIPPNQYWHCSLVIAIAYSGSLSSTLFILNMTFDRFYSIIRPHKAASFNTVKRAKISIISIVIFSFLLGIPHLFMTTYSGRTCISNAVGFDAFYGQFYYWFSLLLQFIIPFSSLLLMNSVIIHTLRKRSKFVKTTKSENEGQGQSEGQSSKIKNSERQIYVMLLSVTFGFLILITPIYAMAFYILSVQGTTPYYFAGFHLFYHLGDKTYYTNHGINFYLYVITGTKFRQDLKKLFQCGKEKLHGDVASSLSDVNTITTSVQVTSNCHQMRFRASQFCPCHM